MPNERTVTLRVNGRDERGRFPAHRTLLEALREIGHTEVKCGCEKGDCGACAVLVDGMAVDSCLTLAWTAEGAEITTVRGLGDLEALHPVQQALADGGGAQCGYCIPGIVIAAKAIIDEHPEPTEDDVRLGLSGNLCRCTGYTKVFEAVGEAAAVMRAGRGGVRSRPEAPVSGRGPANVLAGRDSVADVGGSSPAAAIWAGRAGQ